MFLYICDLNYMLWGGAACLSYGHEAPFFPHWNVPFSCTVLYPHQHQLCHCLIMYEITNTLKKEFSKALFGSISSVFVTVALLPLWSDQTSLPMEKWSGMPVLCQRLSISLWWKCFGLQEFANLSCWLKALLQVPVLMCTVNNKSVWQRSLNVMLKQCKGGASSIVFPSGCRWLLLSCFLHVSGV